MSSAFAQIFVLLASLLSQVLAGRVLSGTGDLGADVKLFTRLFYPGLQPGLGLKLDQTGLVTQVYAGQAKDVGVKPGWRLISVDNRSYTAEWMRLKSSGKREKNTYYRIFQPGTWGASLGPDGTVQFVLKPSQADTLELGYKVTHVDGIPYNFALLKDYINGTKPYTVTFQDEVLPQPYIATFIKEDHPLPWPEDSSKCLLKGGLHTDFKCCCAQVCKGDSCGIRGRIYASEFTGPVAFDQARCSKWTPAEAVPPGYEVRDRKKKCMTNLDARPGFISTLDNTNHHFADGEFFGCQPICEKLFA